MPSHGFASPTIPGNTNWRQKASSTPAATAILRSSQELRRDTAITERSTSVLLALGSVAFAPEADVSAESVTDVIKKAKARGVRPISKDRSMIARLPLSGDVVAYLVSEDYDPRDIRSLSRAEIYGRAQAWTYLEILRELPGWEHAHLASTGPEFGTRESRHINSVEQLTWQHVTEGRHAKDCVALGSWGVEWHDRETFESSFVYPPDCGTYDIPLGCLRSVDTSSLFAAGQTADGDSQAGASLRVMGTFFATGQVAGVAAECHARRGCLEAAEVRKILASQDALLDPADLPPPVRVIEK